MLGPTGKASPSRSLSAASSSATRSSSSTRRPYDTRTPGRSWRVLAAREILRLYRNDRERLRQLIALHGAKATAEEVFHPQDRTRSFADPDELADASDDGDLVEIPRHSRFGFRVSPQLGELADEVGAERSLYRGLRPE